LSNYRSAYARSQLLKHGPATSTIALQPHLAETKRCDGRQWRTLTKVPDERTDNLELLKPKPAVR
jgi:hypothetical protein